MNISEYSVQRPVTMVVIFALLMVVAAFLVPQLAVDMYPDSSPPVLSVSTSYDGAGPEDVEANITEVLESALASVTGVESMDSTSSFESSRITLEFGFDVDLDDAKSEVESIITQVSGRLPDDADTPTVFSFDFSNEAIVRLVVQGDVDLDEMKTIAEDDVAPLIERIDGVASTSVTGGASYIVQVALSNNRLAAFDLSISDVTSALSVQNVLVGGGTLTQGSSEFQIMTKDQLTSIEDVENIIIDTVESSGSSTGTTTTFIRLSDIADVTMENENASTQVLINGAEGIYIDVQKDSEGNSVQIAAEVKNALDGINAELPEGVSLRVLSDSTTMIEATLNQVYKSAFQGAILAMVILLIFLRNFKGMFIVGLSIPISILITLMCMSIFGLTLNMLTLTGLVLGLGMIVDGSIVILENIHAYRMRGTHPSTAAILGSQEMFRAIVASTMTTLLVFLPVIIFQNDLGMMGQMFGGLVFTVVISLVVSLAVAIIVVPALAGPIMKLHTRRQKPLKNPVLKALDQGMDKMFGAMENGYSKILEYSLNNRLLVIGFSATLLIFSIAQAGNLGVNLFSRSSSDDTIDISVTLPAGTTIDETQSVLLQLQEAIVEEVEGYENLTLSAGSGGGFGGSSSSNKGTVRITLPSPEDQIDTPTSIREKLADNLSSIAGAEVEFSAGRSFGSSSAVDIEIRSDSQTASLQTAQDIRNILLKYQPEVVDPVISLESGGPQLDVVVDQDRAAELGVSTSTIASAIRVAINGSTVTTMEGDDGNIDVEVILGDGDMQDSSDIESLFVTNSSGEQVYLANVVDIQETTSPSSIEREEQQRVIHVTGDLQDGLSTTTMTPVIQATVEGNLVVPDGVEVSFSGQAREIRETGSSFAIIIVAAIILVFGVMASQFESFIDPLIIFFSIPLLFIGVIWVYLITGEAFSMFSAVGVVALVGIVVNNGIVLVDYTNTLRARGMKVREAVIAAGKNRLQPILMTTLTTVLGMVPLAFFPGDGAETIQPIGKTIVGGLVVGSIMTLFVTPVMYSLFNSRFDRKKKGQISRLEAIEAAEGGKV